MIGLFLNLIAFNSNAQQKLIHYWHFNNLVNFTTVAVSPSTFPSIKANFSSLDTNKALIAFRPLAGTAGNLLTYYDNVSPGDTVNARQGQPAGLGLRPRNPTDSMQLMFYIPTTHYQNITVKFEVQKSSASNGGYVDTFSYSLDSGATWKTSGLSILTASNGTGSWTSTPGISVNINSDALANNNAQLVFRIRFGGGGTTGTSGNVRFDNITIEGDTITTMPIKLLNFNAQVEDGNNIAINWKTTSEIDNDFFVVEKSFDALNWNEIAKVKSAGNTNTITNYQINDLATTNSPLVYYRLKQIDINGTLTSFDPIVVSLKNNLPNLISIENPVTNNLSKVNIISANQTLVNVTVRNLFGAEVKNMEHALSKGNNSFDIDFTDLSSGLYFVEIRNGLNILAIKKIIK